MPPYVFITTHSNTFTLNVGNGVPPIPDVSHIWEILTKRGDPAVIDKEIFDYILQYCRGPRKYRILTLEMKDILRGYNVFALDPEQVSRRVKGLMTFSTKNLDLQCNIKVHKKLYDTVAWENFISRHDLARNNREYYESLDAIHNRFANCSRKFREVVDYDTQTELVVSMINLKDMR